MRNDVIRTTGGAEVEAAAQAALAGPVEALRVTPEGAVHNGNTRLTVLKERGYDVDSLPRERYEKTGMTDEEMWAMEQ